MRLRERDSVWDCGDRDARLKPAPAAPLSLGIAWYPSTALYPASESNSASAWCRILCVSSTPSSLRKAVSR